MTGKRPPDPCSSWKNETFAPQILVTVQPLHLLVFIFMKTRSLVVPPYADLDEKVLMQASLHKHFFIQTSAWLNCNKYCAIFEKTACILADGMVKYKTVVSERRGNPVDTEA